MVDYARVISASIVVYDNYCYKTHKLKVSSSSLGPPKHLSVHYVQQTICYPKAASVCFVFVSNKQNAKVKLLSWLGPFKKLTCDSALSDTRFTSVSFPSRYTRQTRLTIWSMQTYSTNTMSVLKMTKFTWTKTCLHECCHKWQWY